MLWISVTKLPLNQLLISALNLLLFSYLVVVILKTPNPHFLALELRTLFFRGLLEFVKYSLTFKYKVLIIIYYKGFLKYVTNSVIVRLICSYSPINGSLHNYVKP